MITVKIVKMNKEISQYNYGYIFCGRRVYTEFLPHRYMRLLARLSPWVRLGLMK